MSDSCEPQKIPELQSEELLGIIDGMKIQDGEQFTFNGVSYYLCLLNQGEAEHGGEDAFFNASTYIHGYDIYILETLPPEERKRKLFHEILEANITGNLPSEQAHEIALQEEERIFGKRK